MNLLAVRKIPKIEGGATDIKNCEMLCKTHNRAKEKMMEKYG